MSHARGIAYLLCHVIEPVGEVVNSVADKDDVGVRIGIFARTIVVFLAAGVPESKLDRHAIDGDVADGDGVVETRVPVVIGGARSELAVSKRQHHAGPSRGPIPHEDQFLPDGRHDLKVLKDLS